MSSKGHKGSNVQKRPRFIVTVKRQAVDGPPVFKIIGPDRNTELRSSKGMSEIFMQPFRDGAKEIKAEAYLKNDGRWQLEKLIAPI